MDPKLIRLIPLILLMVVLTALTLGLFSARPSIDRAIVMAGIPVDPFDVPALDNPATRFTPKIWAGQAVVLNVFASWCAPCQKEHGTLMYMAQTGKVRLYGLDWRDKPDNVRQWLTHNGNPYQLIGLDQYGQTSLALSLSGVPETMVINKAGRVVYHTRQPLTHEVVDTVIIPLFQKLNNDGM
jgi:DsbE subfamily thiol:disulfide oxidoreductase